MYLINKIKTWHLIAAIVGLLIIVNFWQISRINKLKRDKTVLEIAARINSKEAQALKEGIIAYSDSIDFYENQLDSLKYENKDYSLFDINQLKYELRKRTRDR